MFRNRIVWSLVEEVFLEANRDIMSIKDLAMVLSKSQTSIRNKLKELDGHPVSKPVKKTKIGRREDLGLFCRSGWEANCMRYLTSMGLVYLYEPRVFYFEGYKRGTISYLPDLLVQGESLDGVWNMWLEIKGQLTSQGRTAIRRFKKFYPEEFSKLRAIVGRPNTQADLFFKELGVPIFAYMNELDKKYKDVIPHWE